MSQIFRSWLWLIRRCTQHAIFYIHTTRSAQTILGHGKVVIKYFVLSDVFMWPMCVGKEGIRGRNFTGESIFRIILFQGNEFLGESHFYMWMCFCKLLANDHSGFRVTGVWGAFSYLVPVSMRVYLEGNSLVQTILRILRLYVLLSAGSRLMWLSSLRLSLFDHTVESLRYSYYP